MPTVAELERLEALIGQLIPLSDKQRGELIAAGDWNVLVGALIEVGRAALGSEDDDTVAPHDHPDQVSIGWLDPRVRQLVTGGGVKDPGAEVTIGKLRRDITNLTTRLDEVGAEVKQARTRVETVATKDLAREADVSRLNRKVLGAADDRGDIADLRTTLHTLETEVGRAVEVGALLEVNGQTIDVPGLVTRVAAVEELRDRLTQPNGELLDASAFEIRLLEIQTSLVTEDDLTEAIDSVRTDIDTGGFDIDAVLELARGAGREVATTAVATAVTDLQSSISSRFADIEGSVPGLVEQATASVVDDVVATTRADITAAVNDLDGSVRSDLGTLIDERTTAATQLVEAQLATLPDLVGVQVDEQLDSRLPAALADVTGRLDAVQTSVTALDGRIAGNGQAIATATTAFEAGRREDAESRANLRAEMLDRITSVEDRIEPRLVLAVDEARTALRAELTSTVTAARRDMEAGLAETARQAAATEVQVLGTTIRTDLQSMVRQEIEANRDTIRADIATEIEGLQRRVAGMVATEVTRATADLPNMVTREFEAFRPEIDRIIDGRVNRPPID
ncbi:hypothetical protein BH24ACT5_BH24ACT5_17210 [soil metagenome]